MYLSSYNIFHSGNSHRQNWSLWWDISISDWELEYCEMGCSWNCYLWGKQEVVWLSFERKPYCFAVMWFCACTHRPQI